MFYQKEAQEKLAAYEENSVMEIYRLMHESIKEESIMSISLNAIADKIGHCNDDLNKCLEIVIDISFYDAKSETREVDIEKILSGTLLHYACIFKRGDICDLLLKKGASSDIGCTITEKHTVKDNGREPWVNSRQESYANYDELKNKYLPKQNSCPKPS